MPVRQFLSTISPVIAREPSVFVEAMANTCNVEEASGAMGSGRPIVLLKPKVPIFCTLTASDIGGCVMPTLASRHLCASHLPCQRLVYNVWLYLACTCIQTPLCFTFIPPKTSIQSVTRTQLTYCHGPNQYTAECMLEYVFTARTGNMHVLYGL